MRREDRRGGGRWHFSMGGLRPSSRCDVTESRVPTAYVNFTLSGFIDFRSPTGKLLDAKMAGHSARRETPRGLFTFIGCLYPPPSFARSPALAYTGCFRNIEQTAEGDKSRRGVVLYWGMKDTVDEQRRMNYGY